MGKPQCTWLAKDMFPGLAGVISGDSKQARGPCFPGSRSDNGGDQQAQPREGLIEVVLEPRPVPRWPRSQGDHECAGPSTKGWGWEGTGPALRPGSRVRCQSQPSHQSLPCDQLSTSAFYPVPLGSLPLLAGTSQTSKGEEGSTNCEALSAHATFRDIGGGPPTPTSMCGGDTQSGPRRTASERVCLSVCVHMCVPGHVSARWWRGRSSLWLESLPRPQAVCSSGCLGLAIGSEP